jgi:hypothetical protein
MRSTWLRVAALSAALAAGACSLLTDLDGLSGGTIIIVAADGAPDDAALAESSADARIDAPVADAGRDGPFCETTTERSKFCSSFEEPGAPTSQWTATAGGAGKLLLTDAESRSPPFSMMFTQPSGGGSTAYVRRDFPAVATRMKLSADVRPGLIGAVSTIMQIGTGGPLNYEVKIRFGVALGTSLREDEPDPDGGPDVEHVTPIPSTLGADKWTRVSLEIKIGVNASTADVTFDGQVVLRDVPLFAHRYRKPMHIGAGLITSVSPSKTQSIHVDNVVFDYDE